MAEEYPALGKYYIIGNASDAQAFPIVGITFDMKKGGYQEPNFGDTIPADANMPNDLSPSGFIFHKSTVTAPDQRITFQYDLLPSCWIYDETVDSESLNIIFEKRRNNIGVNIIPGATIFSGSGASLTAVLTGGVVTSVTISNGGTGYGEFVNIRVATGGGRTAVMYAHSTNGIIDMVSIYDGGTAYGSAPTLTVLPKTLVQTDRRNGRSNAAPEDMDFNVSHEVVTIFPQPLYADLSSALLSQREMSFPFPSRLDVLFVQLTQNADIGYIQPRSSRVAATIKTYWVISDTEPTPPAYDVISPEPTISVSVGNPGTTAGVTGIATYRSVLIDATSQWYSTAGGFLLIRFNASTPSFSTYQGITYNQTTISCTNGTNVISGSGTHFLTDQFVVGQPWGNTTIQSIDSDTHMTLVANYTGTTITNAPFLDRVVGAGWVGTVKEPIAPSITPEKFTKLWRIERVFMTMQ